MQNVQATDLQRYIDENALFIDIRESYEQPKFVFTNHLEIPTSELTNRLDEIPKEGNVLIYCQLGGRSTNVVTALEAYYGYGNLINIAGGAVMMAMALPELRK